nr:MAG TPA: hypothetical protein [Caudoviricetes sp.]
MVLQLKVWYQLLVPPGTWYHFLVPCPRFGL